MFYRKRSKYGAIKTISDGIQFASRHEAKVYGDLKLMERYGELKILQLQKPFSIEHNGIKICTYIADFEVKHADGTVCVIDAKGMKTPVYNLKKKLMKAFYGIEIMEF